MTWHPSESDLSPWMLRELEAAYQNRARARCSRDDFRDGFLAALVALNSKPSFVAGTWQADSGGD